ncbi:unnamed protein product (macronuclear) [Paramecium tetraurelia]|uniref:Origin recognition complex subunit 1 n=1 Tax=Paramecium tetraurelia TaxID=5888 RepID=A0BMS0_PARTE|nr:uncharacterized protein GSPATT00030473001 [Paramecium tetraurelia]CAK59837.1 unnamed protein product [Paramecium tetraurelia]|eukprot:XP_001427235.1 hypothetical protein (macronuclear) [Paramecium tetraurelia strain d4-2]
MAPKKQAQKKQTQTTKKQPTKIEKVQPAPIVPNAAQNKPKNNKPDFYFVIPQDEEEHYRREVYQRRENRNKSCIDINEIRQDNFAPQEIPAINKVTQKIVIEQECTNDNTQLFTLNPSEQSTSFSRQLNKPKIISIKPKKLLSTAKTQDQSMDMEDDWYEELNKDINHTKHFLLGVPKPQSDHKEKSLTTERNSTTKNIKKMDLDLQIEPSQTTAKLTKAMKTKLDSMNECYNSLLEATVPDEILCRDQEKDLITKFIEDGIKNNGQSQALYISGVPGIGKTATVMEVQKKLSSKKDNFQFIYANAMNFGLPDNIYSFLLEKLTNIKDASKVQACILLTELFTKGCLPATYKAYEKSVVKKNRVILLDECDNLFTPDQQVLYNLVDWPQQKHAKLTIIMIANTMDFPERLKPKLQSRLGNHRVVFRPYTSAQIETILQQRMKEKKIKELFASNTLNYLGKKIATISTDIRKTLCVCRKAIEIGKEELVKTGQFKQIEVNHVKLAYDKIYNKAYHSCLHSFSRSLKLLIITIALEIHIKGYNVAYLQQVLSRYNQYLIQNKDDPIGYQEMKQILLKLSELNLVEIKEQNVLLTKTSWQQKVNDSLQKDNLRNINEVMIHLKINVDDIKNGLSNDTLFLQFSQFF